MNILGIESSCDDTSVSLVEDGYKIRSLVSQSQYSAHEKFSGVVPEIASREHLKAILPTCKAAIQQAKISLNNIDAIAVTTQPGLIGSLVVGVNFAKGLAYKLKKPIIPVNHLIAHIYAAFFENKIDFPLLALLISGGHTAIVMMQSFFEYTIIGKTLDDSCGEAFDKIAKYFNLGYPGGPIIDKLAQKGNSNAYNFPTTLVDIKKYGANFSFSGLKTAVIHFRKKYKNIDSIGKETYEESVEDIAASFQKTMVDTLLLKTRYAIDQTGIKKLVIAGGSSANTEIRKRFNLLKKNGIEVYFPPSNLCTDNGAMVAGLAYHIFIHEYLKDKDSSSSFDFQNYRFPFELNPQSRVPDFGKKHHKY